MADRTLMTPSAVSFSGLLTNGIVYTVPIFQRDYSWKEDNWLALWEDITIAITSGREHYMGAVVVQTAGEKRFIVIDGQQRFTTLSLLVLAVIRNIQDLVDSGIEETDNKMRIEELRRSFLGQRNASSLNYSSKLFLNENNDSFYQSYLLQLREPQNEKRLSPSDRLMWQAFQFFCEKLKTQFATNNNGAALAAFLSDVVGDRLRFIKIEVEDELSAYALFETLNYRGVDLTVTDLLKNFLFSKLSSVDLDIAKNLWKQIAATIGLEKFPTYLRHYWISRNKLVREEQLFKAIRNEVTDVEKVFQLLRKLEQLAPMYIALQDPWNSEWKGSREKRKRIKEFELFGLKEQLPLLLAAHEKWNDTEFDKLLRLLTVIAFRYNVVGERQANTMEDLYNKASIAVSNGAVTNTAQLFDHIKAVYVSDTDFQADFSSKEVLSYGRTKKLVRYILFELENHKAGTDKNYDDDPATIEHILPEHAGQEWEEVFPANVQPMFVYRLGNYTLLEDDKNRYCGTLPFAEKKAVYHESQYKLSTLIQQNSWNPDQLEARQQQMAKWATACWRVPYADKPGQ